MGSRLRKRVGRRGRCRRVEGERVARLVGVGCERYRSGGMLIVNVAARVLDELVVGFGSGYVFGVGEKRKVE